MKTTLSKINALVQSHRDIQKFDFESEYALLLKKLNVPAVEESILVSNNTLSFKEIHDISGLDFALFTLQTERHLYPIVVSMLREFGKKVKHVVKDQKTVEIFESVIANNKPGESVNVFFAAAAIIDSIEEKLRNKTATDEEISSLKTMCLSLCQPKKSPFAAIVCANEAYKTKILKIEEDLSEIFMDFFGKDFISDDLLEKFSKLSADEIESLRKQLEDPFSADTENPFNLESEIKSITSMVKTAKEVNLPKMAEFSSTENKAEPKEVSALDISKMLDDELK